MISMSGKGTSAWRVIIVLAEVIAYCLTNKRKILIVQKFRATLIRLPKLETLLEIWFLNRR